MSINQKQEKTIRKIQKNEILLRKSYVERDEVFNLLFIAYLANMNVLMLGAPGLAKSHILKNFAHIFDGKFFFIQLMKSTKMEELAGPYRLTELRNDLLVRNTDRKLPWADFAFIDEVFHGSSHILQGLNEILNEKTYEGNPIPLKIAVGTTNFVTDDIEVEAFYDRWTCRYFVRDIMSSKNFQKMFDLPEFNPVKINMGEMEDLANLLPAVDISNIIPVVSELRDNLRDIEIEASPRRWMQGMQLIRASALLNERMVATSEDMQVLRHILWDTEQQIEPVRKQVESVVDPTLRQLHEFILQGKELYEMGNSLNPRNNAELQSIASNVNALERLEDDIERILTRGDISPMVRQMGEQTKNSIQIYRNRLFNRMSSAV